MTASDLLQSPHVRNLALSAVLFVTFLVLRRFALRALLREDLAAEERRRLTVNSRNAVFLALVLVMIFIWGPACPPCERQWKDMRARGLVAGEEDGGQLIKYTESVAFYSLDASTSSNGETAAEVYNPSATPAGTPTTIFATHMKDESGKNVIGWYSQKGYMDPTAVENVLTVALNMHH